MSIIAFCLGQVVEILPPDEGTPSIKVTSIDGPPNKSEMHSGPIPKTPCPPMAQWVDDEDHEDAQWSTDVDRDY